LHRAPDLRLALNATSPHSASAFARTGISGTLEIEVTSLLVQNIIHYTTQQQCLSQIRWLPRINKSEKRNDDQSVSNSAAAVFKEDQGDLTGLLLIPLVFLSSTSLWLAEANRMVRASYFIA
jgi:hypothetical protein